MTARPYEIVTRFGATKRVGVAWRKRDAIRRCRDLTLGLGAGASGEVKQQGAGRVYSCYAIQQGERVVLKVDPA